MANINAPMGFRPIKHQYGTILQIENYTVAGGVTLYQGSPCLINASGLAAAYTNTGALAGQVLGVAMAYTTAGGTAPICTDPDQLYELQADDNSITNVAGSRGALFRLTTPAAGNTTQLQSKCQLDASTAVAVTGTGVATVTPVRVEYRIPQIDNNIGGSPAVSWTRFAVRFIPPVMHRGMGRVGLNSAFFRGI